MAKNFVSDILKIVEDQTYNKGMRFGQVIDNVFSEIARSGADPFFVSDEKFLECLKKYAEFDDQSR